jgi:hypothetical protein
MDKIKTITFDEFAYDVAYRMMATDYEREAEAQEWCSGLGIQLGSLSKAVVWAVDEANQVQLGMPK